MTQLLISVRDLAEARAVLAIDGVDHLDVKQPRLGSLGKADPQVLKEVVDEVARRIPVSAACGELVDGELLSLEQRSQPTAGVWDGIQFFKLGLAGAAAAPDWPDRWARAIEAIHDASDGNPPRPVAVAYADWREVDAPEPADVIETGSSLGCGAALLDTCGKSRGSVTRLWTQAQIAAFVQHARRNEMLAVVGGSLTIDTIPQIVRSGAEVVAIRGAACRDERAGELDPDCVRRLVACLRDCRSAGVA